MENPVQDVTNERWTVGIVDRSEAAPKKMTVGIPSLLLERIVP